MAEFGRGLYLVPKRVANDSNNYSWDLDVDETGDLRPTEDGDKELQKDVAFANATFLQNAIGSPLNPESFNEIRMLVKRVLLRDDRINNVNSVRINQVNESDTIEVVALVIASDEQQELVFEVSQ